MHLMLTHSRVRRARSIRHRAGFTMAETLVVLVLLAIVGGSLMKVLTNQQRFYNGTGDLIALRTQLRQAEAVIGNDLRGISSVGSAGVGSDISAMTDSSIDFRYTIGVSVVCKAPVATTIIIPPTGALTNGNALTSWIAKPKFGDTVFVFDEGASATSPTDDSWKPYNVVSLALGAGACDPGFNAPNASTLVTDIAPPATTLDGAPMRYVRHAHYSLYKSTSDKLWYLGYCSPDCSAGISPIAGPFQSYQASTSPDTSGIRITYFDSTGTVTATPAQVARIKVVLRGETKSYLNVTGMTRGVYHDSLSMNIALRNRS
jgi:prepilin-type N-terminal cleavage/methylation domain-containing protein